MTNWTLAARAAKMNPSVIREILKVTEKPGIISFAGGFPDSAMFDVDGISAAVQQALQQTADQTAGVNLYKVQKALMRSDAIGIAEACRTMTKELDTKILPTMDKGSMEYKLFVRLREVLAGGTNDPIGVQEKIRAATGRDLMETAQLIANKLGISIKGG